MDPDALAALLQQNQLMGAMQSPLLALMAQSGVVPTAARPGVGMGGSTGAALQGGNSQYMPTYGVPNNLWNAQVRQESGGRTGPGGSPLVNKTTGARGPAQVMPKTAPDAAKAAGVPYNAASYKNNPMYEARLGRGYMGQQLHNTGGDQPQALANYNTGPGHVRSAINNYGPQGYIPHLPKETRDYVHKIMASARGGASPSQAPSGSTGGGKTFAGGD